MADTHVPKHLRLPVWLDEAIEARKTTNRRSYNQQVVLDLETAYSDAKAQADKAGKSKKKNKKTARTTKR